MLSKGVISLLLVNLAIIPIYVTQALPNTAGENYYWRDYNGIVPLDAIQAGKDSNGKSFYVGLGYVNHVGLQPGTLYPGSTNLTVTAGFQIHTEFKNVKILCSPNYILFSWIPTNNEKFEKLFKKCHLVPGGTEQGTIDLFIGRTIHEGDLYAGKLYPYGNEGLYELCLPKEHGNHEIRYKVYEVLAYNCLEENACTKTNSMNGNQCLSQV